jgi:hypothetical protein
LGHLAAFPQFRASGFQLLMARLGLQAREMIEHHVERLRVEFQRRAVILAAKRER